MKYKFKWRDIDAEILCTALLKSITSEPDLLKKVTDAAKANPDVAHHTLSVLVDGVEIPAKLFTDELEKISKSVSARQVKENLRQVVYSALDPFYDDEE